MSKPSQPYIRKPPTGRTNLASCIVATVFLLFLLIIASITYLTLFKPQPPKLSVTAVSLPSFSAANSSVTFTFSQYAAVSNPNRAAFSHYDSSIKLIYAGNQIGFMFIPAGEVAAGKTEIMAATFAVRSFPVVGGVGQGQGHPMSVGPTLTDGVNGFRVGPSMEVESVMELAGRVRVLGVFTHRAVARADCRVAVAVSDGSVMGFHC